MTYVFQAGHRSLDEKCLAVSEKLTRDSRFFGYGKKYFEGGNRKALTVCREKHRHKGGLKPAFVDAED